MSPKGKHRAFTRDEGSGALEGIVLPLDVSGSGVEDIPITNAIHSPSAYTIPIRFGDRNQNISVQWVASTSCTTSSCNAVRSRYNPDGSDPTNQTFSISYLQGTVSGPIVWDHVEVGGYSIESQAFAAADNVANEPLTSKFAGILGLALPLNSIISETIPPVRDNSPDGRHPTEIVTDPKKIHYSNLVSDRLGILYWKTSLRAITVYVDSVAKPVNIGRSITGAAFPSAVLDSGGPYILTTTAIANAIYGAIGVSPANDGKCKLSDYVRCDTPLNMTFTLDDRPEFTVHPLDLTTQPGNDNRAQFCVGLIQPADTQLAANPAIGDMILGVPFMRNVYSVMAYTPPTTNGTFIANDTDVSPSINPRLGLLGLTDPTVALDEFNRVRVLNQALDPPSSGSATTSGDSGKKMSVGIIVLIGLVGFFGLCFALFALRYFLTKRRWKRAAARDLGDTKEGLGGYQERRQPTEDQLRAARFEAYMQKERINSSYTASSDRTQVVDPDPDPGDGELGFKRKSETDPWDPATAVDWGDNTLVATRTRLGPGELNGEIPSTVAVEDTPRPHLRTLSELDMLNTTRTHERNPSSAPLLPESVLESDEHPDVFPDFGVLPLEGGMAGIGSAARNSKIEAAPFRHSVASTSSGGSPVAQRGLPHTDSS
ncbi:aspartic peptidase domain-containing protein [Infundibulicybe gibba]|nr:aspartic peptidase domain-containing protein [Infundibulicybe gibba]